MNILILLAIMCVVCVGVLFFGYTKKWPFLEEYGLAVSFPILILTGILALTGIGIAESETAVQNLIDSDNIIKIDNDTIYYETDGYIKTFDAYNKQYTKDSMTKVDIYQGNGFSDFSTVTVTLPVEADDTDIQLEIHKKH